MNLNDTQLVKSLGSEDADGTKEVNKSNSYVWMKNKWGRLVPIATHLIIDKLSRGFIHTDGVVHSDAPEDRVKAPELEHDPAKAMAAVAQQMAKAQELQTEAIIEIAKKRRTKKK